MIHSSKRQPANSWAWWLLAIAGSTALPAHALQSLEVRDGEAVVAKLSLKEPTRVKAEGARILDVIGNIYDASRNAGGEVAVEKDLEAGEVFLTARGGAKPVNLFIKTEKGTYTVLFQPVDMPADTVILRDRSRRAVPEATVSSAGNAGAHVRVAKGMILAMAGERAPNDVEVREVGAEVRLWQEARVTLQRRYLGRTSVGERYLLTNVSAAPMRLAEQEFYQDNVIAVAIEGLSLAPGESANVFVVRARGAHE